MDLVIESLRGVESPSYRLRVQPFIIGGMSCAVEVLSTVLPCLDWLVSASAERLLYQFPIELGLTEYQGKIEASVL